MANPLVCIFNPITTLIDQVQSESTFTGASAAGAPVVLNLLGRLDPSLLGEGIDATAGELLTAGALINLYNNGGNLYMQNAFAGTAGVPPSGGSYPKPAVGFVSNNTSISNSGLILFQGTFTYADPNSEFAVGDIGKEVYLSPVTPGGVTKTAPSGGGQLTQSVGNMVGFTAPNFVLVSFVASPQPPTSSPGGISTNIQFNNSGVFGGIPGSTADGTNGLMTLAPTGTGVALTLTGDASSSDILDLYANGAGSPAFSFAATSGSEALLSINDGSNNQGTLFFGGGEASLVVSDHSHDQAGVQAISGTALVYLQDSASGSFNVQIQSTGGVPQILLRKQSPGHTTFIGQGTGLTTSTIFNFPPTNGTSGYVLQTDGSGNTSWVASGGGGGTPGGTPTQIQYNLAGAFAGINGSSVTPAGAVALAPTGTGVALTATGDSASSDLLDLVKNGGSTVFSVEYNGSTTISTTTGGATLTLQSTVSDGLILQCYAPSLGGGASVMQVDDTGSIYLGSGSASTLPGHATVLVIGDQNNNKMIAFYPQDGIINPPSDYIDNWGSVYISPISTATAPALLVNDDGSSVNDIAQFNHPAGGYSVVEIGQPLANPALTVVGDATTATFVSFQHGGGGVSFSLDQNGLLSMAGGVDTASDNFPFIINNQTSIANTTGTVSPRVPRSLQQHSVYRDRRWHQARLR